MNTVTSVIIALALAMALGCNKKETRSQSERPAADNVGTGDTVQPTENEAHDVSGAADQDRDEWVRRSEERLSELDRQIDELRARGSAAADEAGDEAMDNLQQARREAREALKKARNASSDAWESTKRTADEMIDRLQSAYRGAAEGLRNER